MMNLDDERWNSLKGGYGVAWDPRPLLLKIEAGRELEATWDELWGKFTINGTSAKRPTRVCRIWCGFIADRILGATQTARRNRLTNQGFLIGTEPNSHKHEHKMQRKQHQAA